MDGLNNLSCIKLGNFNGYDGGNYAGNVYKKIGLSPALNTMGGGYRQPIVVDEIALPEKEITMEKHIGSNTKYRIRKLTPVECWRLMNFKDSDFKRAEAVNSNTQLYKQAGNAIVRGVLMAIMSQLNIDGVKPWNEMDDEERYKLIYDGTTQE